MFARVRDQMDRTANSDVGSIRSSIDRTGASAGLELPIRRFFAHTIGSHFTCDRVEMLAMMFIDCAASLDYAIRIAFPPDSDSYAMAASI